MRLTGCVLLTLVLPSAALAETVDEAYGRALKDYYTGQYAKAVEGFERVLAVPMDHEDVHYNLGCAFFRMGKLGPAIYHFERALAMDSSAEDARFNLETSRAMVAAQVKDEIRGAGKDPWWMRSVGLLGLRGWAVLFLLLWWGALAIFFLLRFIDPGPARAGFIAWDCFLVLLALITALLLSTRIYLAERVSSGIVLPDRLEVHEGPDVQTKVSFAVHAGLRLRLQAREGRWLRIRLANGLEGWAPEQQIGILPP